MFIFYFKYHYPGLLPNRFPCRFRNPRYLISDHRIFDRILTVRETTSPSKNHIHPVRSINVGNTRHGESVKPRDKLRSVRPILVFESPCPRREKSRQWRACEDSTKLFDERSRSVDAGRSAKSARHGSPRPNWSRCAISRRFVRFRQTFCHRFWLASRASVLLSLQNRTVRRLVSVFLDWRISRANRCAPREPRSRPFGDHSRPGGWQSRKSVEFGDRSIADTWPWRTRRESARYQNRRVTRVRRFLGGIAVQPILA